MATDADENDMLTYTLWYGTSADNITTKGKSSAPTKQGETVTIEQNEGLSNDTMYWFKVVVPDGTNETTSGEGNENTYCKGEYCEGGGTTKIDCTACGGKGSIECKNCSGAGFIDRGLADCGSCQGSGVIHNSCDGNIDYTSWFLGPVEENEYEYCPLCHENTRYRYRLGHCSKCNTLNQDRCCFICSTFTYRSNEHKTLEKECDTCSR